MKPKKNRIYCRELGRIKMLFLSEKKAMNFIRFNADEIIEETGKAPVRCYYCNSCAGWHVTSNPNQEYYMEKQYQETFNWDESQKSLTESIDNLRSAYLRRRYVDCYKYIEEAYIKIGKAERAHIDSSEYEEAVDYLERCANGLHKICPGYNPKLNLSIKLLEKKIGELRNAAHSFTDDFSICEKLLGEIDVEMKKAICFGASVERLKKYRKVYDKYSSPTKIRLKMERKELYQQIVDCYRKKNYQGCGEAIKLSYQNFYVSLNEGVAERDIQSAMKRIEYFKEFVEKLKEKESAEKKAELFDFDEILDVKYGKDGTPEREEFHKRAVSYVWLYGYGDQDIVLPPLPDQRIKQPRDGWADAFAGYVEEGEDEMMLPDCIDNDGEIEL